MSIVFVVCCLWCVVLLGCHVCATLLQFKCTDRFETCHCLQMHADVQVVYKQYSVTLISVTFLVVTIDQCLMILIVGVCMEF